ncbi:MAG: preprotein translocase subunit Sec61beta [Candidatus Heimdallarchaeota archaeon]|nr:preprotein translocase subunit Sec61beta [Candidatus Heimdallarchaeota archaeon]MCK5298947.1 preprotein translocase subunit Sec61beta [Candidatus Heimdallarchaeota archaeon]
MSRRQKSSDGGGAMPATGAGLIRFFEEDTPGIKVGPYAVMIFAAALIILVLAGPWLFRLFAPG